MATEVENVMSLALADPQDTEDEDELCRKHPKIVDVSLELLTQIMCGGGLTPDLDETLSERLWGLTEMFPDPVQRVLGSVVSQSTSALVAGYSLGCSALWIAASSATIMVLPVVFESERAQQQQQELQQQRQILLGPNAAVSGSAGQNLLPGMGVMPPGMAPGK